MPSVMDWKVSWNNIIRDYIFPDAELKRLMKLPSTVNIIDFIDRYFINAGYTNEVLFDEPVRIIYGDSVVESDARDPNVTQHTMLFDIYVKKENLRDANNDRLQFRTHLIAQRLLYLLTKDRYVEGYRFWYSGDYDIGTRTYGYSRYCLKLSYLKVI